MIGAACSKYVEGLLLIFVRKPYDIGDRIHVAETNTESPDTGASGDVGVSSSPPLSVKVAMKTLTDGRVFFFFVFRLDCQGCRPVHDDRHIRVDK